MTDAKHEAPAEGAGEAVVSDADILRDTVPADLLGREMGCLADVWGVRMDGSASVYPSVRGTQAGAQKLADVLNAQSSEGPRYEIIALRARSSAPEAREEALGNLLAVIHGDGGHRALEVGVEQAAAEAEKIVARLLSSAPEAREEPTPYERSNDRALWDPSIDEGPDPNEPADLVAIQRDQWVSCSPEWLKNHPNGCAEAPRVACKTWDGHSHYHPVNWPTAAPIADKLRIAVEALEPFALIGAHYRTGGLRQDIESRAPSFMRMLDFKAFRHADQALAALKGEANP